MSIKLSTIYKRGKHNKILEWTIEVDENQYRTITGGIDDKKVESAWTSCQGKNIGQTNETSPEDQALKEATAHRKKKLEKGYAEKVEDIDKVGYKEPLLAEEYSKYKNEVIFPVYCQRKYDGIRCIAKADGLYSRTGKKFLGVPHISEHLAKFFETNPNAVLDGELYNHEYKDDFDQIVSCVKKQKPTKTQKKLAREVVQYHIYNLVDEKHVFSERLEILATYAEKFGWKKHNCIKMAETVIANSQEELDAFYEQALEDGYEGEMVLKNAPYVHGRSTNLLKRKEFIDKEFEIVDVLEGKGNRAGMAGKVVVKLENGNTCEANPVGGTNFYIRLLRDKDAVIGKMATIRFQNYTPDGSLRFPRMISVRDYE